MPEARGDTTGHQHDARTASEPEAAAIVGQEQIDRTPIDKSTWGDGPWQTEPDRVEWEHAGLPCLALRNPMMGQWCGYAAVPPGHPLHGRTYDGDVDLSVHGGVTYADRCDGARICHVAKPGEPEDVWWFGFDCGHAFDILPAMEARMRVSGWPSLDDFPQCSYKTLAYVQAETNGLASSSRRWRRGRDA